MAGYGQCVYSLDRSLRVLIWFISGADGQWLGLDFRGLKCWWLQQCSVFSGHRHNVLVGGRGHFVFGGVVVMVEMQMVCGNLLVKHSVSCFARRHFDSPTSHRQ
jgi:hypothetical protein